MKTEMSENIADLVQGLIEVQRTLQPAVKDGENEFFQSSYATLKSVWESSRESLSKNGLAVIQSGSEGCLMTTLIHTSGQWIRGSFPLVFEKKTAQGQGSAITYLRRYSLAAMLGIVVDDDDAEASMNRSNISMEKKEKVEMPNAPRANFSAAKETDRTPWFSPDQKGDRIQEAAQRKNVNITREAIEKFVSNNYRNAKGPVKNIKFLKSEDRKDLIEAIRNGTLERTMQDVAAGPIDSPTSPDDDIPF
jgi:hypothetical protein